MGDIVPLMTFDDIIQLSMTVSRINWTYCLDTKASKDRNKIPPLQEDKILLPLLCKYKAPKQLSDMISGQANGWDVQLTDDNNC